MSETVQHGGREHLSQDFPEITPGSVFIEHTKPKDTRAANEMDVSDLWRVERDTPHRHGEAAVAFALLSARLYDQNLTVDPAHKQAFGAIRERLANQPGEIAAVFVMSSSQRQQTERAYCYSGILPEEIEFKNDAFKDMVAVPGAVGFRLVRGKDILDLGGNGPRDVLPISMSLYGSDGFSLIPERYTATYAERLGDDRDRQISEFAKDNKPYLLVGPEIPAKILDECSPEMATELIIQIATIIAEAEPKKVTETLGGIAEIAEPLSKIQELANDHKAFYTSVIERNAAYLTDRVSIQQLEPNYTALRNDYKREFRALQTKHERVGSVIQRQITYEKTRTWPYIDFADSRPDTFHSPAFAIAELAHEDKELQSRIERIDAILGVLDLLA